MSPPAAARGRCRFRRPVTVRYLRRAVAARRRGGPDFAQFGRSGGACRGGRAVFFSPGEGGGGTPERRRRRSPRSGARSVAISFGGVFSEVFLQRRVCRRHRARCSGTSFRTPGAVVPARGLEKFLARLLTSENPVISFRPAEVNRGSE